MLGRRTRVSSRTAADPCTELPENSPRYVVLSYELVSVIFAQPIIDADVC